MERVPFESTTKVFRIPSTWTEFKSHIGKEHAPLLLFRGQCSRKPIRTSFHRSDRFDPERFAVEDFQKLNRAISSLVGHPFDISKSEDIGALVGIAQHHGYPTPFLDWTTSPYVAAYFACREVLTGASVEPTVFQFDAATWQAHNSTGPFDLSEPLPTLALLEPSPIKNPRLLPQKSVLMYCNVDNMEHFVARKEQQNRATYLSAYAINDSPLTVLKDLRVMGLDAASLFPGLDGMCRGIFEDSVESV